jgi:hypothetical protein
LCDSIHGYKLLFFGFVSQPKPFGALTFGRTMRFGDVRAAIRFLTEGFLMPIFKVIPSHAATASIRLDC